MTREESIQRAQEAFGDLIREDYKRIDRMKQAQEPIDFGKLTKSPWAFSPATASAP